MELDDMVRRWRVNAEAAGVRLTDEDVERILSRSGLDRALQAEKIVARLTAREELPDYLTTLSGGPGHD